MFQSICSLNPDILKIITEVDYVAGYRQAAELLVEFLMSNNIFQSIYKCKYCSVQGF